MTWQRYRTVGLREYVRTVPVYDWMIIGIGVITLCIVLTLSLLFFREAAAEAARRIVADQELKAWITNEISGLKVTTKELKQDVQANTQTAAVLKKQVAAEKTRPKNVTVVFPDLKPSPTAGISTVPTPRPRAEKKGVLQLR